MSRPGEGRVLVVALVGVMVIGLGGLALWLSKQDEAPSQVPAPAPAKPSPAELAAPTLETFLPVQDEPPKPAEPLRLPAELEQQRETSTRMRSELRESLGAVAARPSDPASAADEPKDPPTLDKEYIRERIIEDLLPVAVECYSSVLAEQPDAGGKIVMRFAILGDPDVGGVVDEATVDPLQSDFDNAFLRECMTQSLMAVNFDAPPEGGRMEVTYPFVFEPGEDE